MPSLRALSLALSALLFASGVASKVNVRYLKARLSEFERLRGGENRKCFGMRICGRRAASSSASMSRALFFFFSTLRPLTSFLFFSPLSPLFPPPTPHPPNQPTTLFDLEIKPSPAALTLPSTISGLVANKTAAAKNFSSSSSLLAALLSSKLHLSPSSKSSAAAPSCDAPSDPAYTSQFNVSTQTIIECTSTPLVSISDFAMGECGSRTTADPRIFGPPAWRAFHLFAQNYPTQPTATVKAACVTFVKSLAYMLPCPHCGFDFISFIQVNDLYEGVDPFNPACKGSQAYSMPCQGPVTVREKSRRGGRREGGEIELFQLLKAAASLSHFYCNRKTRKPLHRPAPTRPTSSTSS